MTDIRLHGHRFVRVEFVLAAVTCGALSVVVAVAAIVRGTDRASAVVAVVFFLGVAINSVAVVRWVAKNQTEVPEVRASLSDLGAFALSTLLPGALALVLRD